MGSPMLSTQSLPLGKQLKKYCFAFHVKQIGKLSQGAAIAHLGWNSTRGLFYTKA